MSNISREARHISLSFKDVTPIMKAIMEKKGYGKPIRSFLNLCRDVLKDTTILNSSLPSVTCLRVFSLDDLITKNVPKCLGKLSHLRYLDLSNNYFEILPNSISITGTHVKILGIKKKTIESLRLEWKIKYQNRVGEGDKWVMEGLQPNPQLKDLFIIGYGAKQFPNWMMNDHELASRILNLIKIEIWFCLECNVLPPHFPTPFSQVFEAF